MRHVISMVATVLIAGLWNVSPAAGVMVQFDRDVYEVNEGATFTAHIQMPEMPAAGLFSMGLTVTYDAASAEVVNVSLAPQLNGDGLGGPPRIELSPGVARIAGAQAGPQIFTGTTLVSVTFANLASLGSSYAVRLETFSSSSQFDVFIDGGGGSLDEQIEFGSATITVVPAPLGMAAMVVAWPWACVRRRPRH